MVALPVVLFSLLSISSAMQGVHYRLVLDQETHPARESGMSKVTWLIRVKENQAQVY